MLDASHTPDWRVFRGVFVRKDYATDYRDSVVVDVGAHRGLFAAFAMQEGCACVLAYEPDPINFSYLRRNTESLATSRQEVRIHPWAVGASSGTVQFYTYNESWSHSLVKRTDRTPVSTIEVSQVAFDQIMDTAVAVAQGRHHIIVKVDAEGAEYDILYHTSPKALARIDELFVETHTYATGTVDDLVNWLTESGLVRSTRIDESPGEHQLLHFIREKEVRKEESAYTGTL